MTGTQMTTAGPRSDGQKRRRRTQGCERRWERVLRLRRLATLLLVVVCGLALGGCGDASETLADLFRINGDAEAQGDVDQLIETVLIELGTFQLQVRDGMMPTIDVNDGTTEYTIQDDTTLTFTLSDGSTATTRALEQDDRVIERPGSSTVTIIRDED